MMMDVARNEAYEAALAQTLSRSPDPASRTVLDIGAGAGLLTLAAARCGAIRVWAVEQSPKLAAALRESVSRNNFSGVVTVLEGDAYDVQVEGLQIGIIVHELFGSSMLAERAHNIVPVLRQRAGAMHTIPSSATTFAVIVDSRHMSQVTHTVSGFDFSSLESVLPSTDMERFVGAGVFGGSSDLVPLTNAVPLLSIDFSHSSPDEVQVPDASTRPAVAIRNGTARAIIVYWTAQLAEGISISTSPFAADSSQFRRLHWASKRYRIVPVNREAWDRRLRPGDQISLAWQFNQQEPTDLDLRVVSVNGISGTGSHWVVGVEVT